MSPEEREINALPPWTAPTMAALALSGVKFTLERDRNVHAWRARWQEPGEVDARHMVEGTLHTLVHRVATARGVKAMELARYGTAVHTKGF